MYIHTLRLAWKDFQLSGCLIEYIVVLSGWNNSKNNRPKRSFGLQICMMKELSNRAQSHGAIEMHYFNAATLFPRVSPPTLEDLSAAIVGLLQFLAPIPGYALSLSNSIDLPTAFFVKAIDAWRLGANYLPATYTISLF